MNNETVNENTTDVFSLDNIMPREIGWLWYPYIPRGKITIIQGDPGEGKTSFVLMLAAELSRGKCFDEESDIEKGIPVIGIFQTAEDGLADTIRPRLDAANADCSKIFVINEKDMPLDMLDKRIERAVEETGAQYVILDPMQAYFGGKVDLNNANSIRNVTKHLSALAEDKNIAIILIGHLNKGNAKAQYRGLGSIDGFAVARSVLLVGRVPDQPNIRAIIQIKNNLEKEGEPRAFKFLEDREIEWIGEYDVSVDEILSGIPSSNKKEKAENFLHDVFNKVDRISANDVFAQAKSKGIGKRTLTEIKSELGITSERIGNEWFWKKDVL